MRARLALTRQGAGRGGGGKPAWTAAGAALWAAGPPSPLPRVALRSLKLKRQTKHSFKQFGDSSLYYFFSQWLGFKRKFDK